MEHHLYLVNHEKVSAVMISRYAGQAVLYVLGPSPFQIPEIVRVIHYSHAVSVLVIHFAFESSLLGR
jgi:hypothetical protein